MRDGKMFIEPAPTLMCFCRDVHDYLDMCARMQVCLFVLVGYEHAMMHKLLFVCWGLLAMAALPTFVSDVVFGLAFAVKGSS